MYSVPKKKMMLEPLFLARSSSFNSFLPWVPSRLGERTCSMYEKDGMRAKIYVWVCDFHGGGVSGLVWSGLERESSRVASRREERRTASKRDQGLVPLQR